MRIPKIEKERETTKRSRPLAINYFVIRNSTSIKKKIGMQFARPQNSGCLSTRMSSSTEYMNYFLFIFIYFFYIIIQRKERSVVEN